MLSDLSLTITLISWANFQFWKILAPIKCLHDLPTSKKKKSGENLPVISEINWKTVACELGVELRVWFLLYLLFIAMKIKSSVLRTRLAVNAQLGGSTNSCSAFPMCMHCSGLEHWREYSHALLLLPARLQPVSSGGLEPGISLLAGDHSSWALEQSAVLAAWLVPAADWEHLPVLAQLRGSRVGIVIRRCVCVSHSISWGYFHSSAACTSV